MRYVSLLLIFILGLGSTQPVSAQREITRTPCTKKKALKAYKSARHADRFGDYQAAIPLYEKCVDDCPEWTRAKLDLAIAYIAVKREADALVILQDICSGKEDGYAIACYHLGRVHLGLAQYAQSAEAFDSYLVSGHKNKQMMRMAEKFKKDALFAMEAVKNPVNVDFIPLPASINSPYSEYLPSYTADEKQMFFTRRIDLFEELFQSDYIDGQWQAPYKWEVPGAVFRKASCSISPDGRLMVFAMADHPSGFGNFDLYFSVLRNGKWSRALNFGPEVNSGGWESQPAIAPDGKTVYFTAARKGGHGNRDIWKTEWQEDGTWSLAENLGPVVNSPFDEESPFLHRDGRTLFFRSNGHPGMGDFDVFFSRSDVPGWSKPFNLGYPINTEGSEGGIYVTMDGKHAIYASDKHGSGGEQLDLYQLELPKKVRPGAATYFHIQSKDCRTDESLQTSFTVMDVAVGDTIFEGSTNKDGYAFFCLPKDRDLSIFVEANGYEFFSDRFELTGTPIDNGYHMYINLCPLEESVNFEPVILKNVLFETGSATLKSASFVELSKLLKMMRDHSDIEIEIQGHTDNVGTPEDNLILSENRAKAVYDYLIEEGISAERLTYVGYGESMPIAENTSESGRQLNRRTAFVVKNR